MALGTDARGHIAVLVAALELIFGGALCAEKGRVSATIGSACSPNRTGTRAFCGGRFDCSNSVSPLVAPLFRDERKPDGFDMPPILPDFDSCGGGERCPGSLDKLHRRDDDTEDVVRRR